MVNHLYFLFFWHWCVVGSTAPAWVWTNRGGERARLYHNTIYREWVRTVGRAGAPPPGCHYLTKGGRRIKFRKNKVMVCFILQPTSEGCSGDGRHHARRGGEFAGWRWRVVFFLEWW